MNVQMTEDVEGILNEYAAIVRRVARSACYSSSVIDIADLHQVGDIAVLRAVKAYDPSAGTNIRSFVARIVRQDIYNEAARFLGVFTVDHRVTSLAAKVHKLYLKGHDDAEIADMLAIETSSVRDMRIAYSRRQQAAVDTDETLDEEYTDERTILDLLNGVVSSDTERSILQLRILGSATVEETAQSLQLPRRRIYQVEAELKHRIKNAIRDATE